MKIGVLANPKVSDAKEMTNEVLGILGDKVDVQLEKAMAEIMGVPGVPVESMSVDVLVTIGGDGTILFALQKCDAIIAGINAGQLGFLTEIPRDQIPDRLEKIIAGEYFVEERIKLKVEHNSSRLPDCTNEAVLHTDHVSKIRHFEMLVDGMPALSIRADGMIISTPTGSTSYSMSVGGPIIDPRVGGFVVVPIAPFNLAIRPLVIPATSQIEIRLAKKRRCVMVLDGQEEFEIGPDDVLTFSRSEKVGRFARFQEDFYTKAWEKLRM